MHLNDDIQGTGAVTVAGLLAATKLAHTKLSEQRIVILGAGSAAVGICDQIVAAMMVEGTSELAARSRLWLVDSQGLVEAGRARLEPFKQKYAQPIEVTRTWQLDDLSKHNFSDVIRNVKPTILILVRPSISRRANFWSSVPDHDFTFGILLWTDRRVPLFSYPYHWRGPSLASGQQSPRE